MCFINELCLILIFCNFEVICNISFQQFENLKSVFDFAFFLSHFTTQVKRKWSPLYCESFLRRLCAELRGCWLCCLTESVPKPIWAARDMTVHREVADMCLTGTIYLLTCYSSKKGSCFLETSQECFIQSRVVVCLQCSCCSGTGRCMEEI